MPIYEYIAVDSSGKEQKGKIDATNSKQVVAQLKQKSLTPSSISLSRSGTAATSKSKGGFKLFQSKIPKNLISNFTRQFATMIDTGIPYNRALEIIIQEVPHPRFQQILSDIRSKVVEGSSLAKALQMYPDIFPNMYVSMIGAGEAGGTLADTMLRQSKFQEEQQALESKVQTAMVYPIVMSVLGIGIVIFMIKFILPKIIPVFQHFNVVLPLPTRIVIFMSDMLSDYGLFVLILIAGMAFFFKKFSETDKGRLIIDRNILKIPLIGEFLNKLLTFKFAQALGTLMASGVELRQSLQIAKYITGNKVYEKSIEELSEMVTKKGFMLSQGLKKANILTASTIQMIRVGEESGRLEQMLLKIAENLEAEVKGTLDKLVAFMEPIIILVMAIGVGFIVMAIMLPIFEMNQLV